MIRNDFDVDIDFANRDDALSLMKHIDASILTRGRSEKHKTGVYFQDIPRNPIVNRSNIDHKDAPEFGFFKIDCLNVSVYEDVESEAHLLAMMDDPDWDIMEDRVFVEQLFHIGDYYNLVASMKPRSVEELAMLLAVIRPAKKHLQNLPWNEVAKDIWKKPTNGYYFKRAHAISYAMAIIVQINLLVEKANLPS